MECVSLNKIMVNPLHKLYRRLLAIDIDTAYIGNYPWIYLDKVNGKRVKEKYMARHGFTVATVSIGGKIELTDTKKIFEIIRKYRKNENP
jgi:hypothetical protein